MTYDVCREELADARCAPCPDRPLRRFAERDHRNIVSWNEYDHGGHWSAYDAPDLPLG